MNDKKKNGYEIRMEMLHLAFRILEQNNEVDRHFAHIKAERGEDFEAPKLEASDVIAKAKELYQFVEQK